MQPKEDLDLHGRPGLPDQGVAAEMNGSGVHHGVGGLGGTRPIGSPSPYRLVWPVMKLKLGCGIPKVEILGLMQNNRLNRD
jgi:hypothetical protein